MQSKDNVLVAHQANAITGHTTRLLLTSHVKNSVICLDLTARWLTDTQYEREWVAADDLRTFFESVRIKRDTHRFLDLVDVMKWNRLRRTSVLQLGQTISLYRKVKINVAASPPSHSMCHAGPRGAIGCWHPSRT